MGMCNRATNLVFGGVGFVQVTIFWEQVEVETYSRGGSQVSLGERISRIERGETHTHRGWCAPGFLKKLEEDHLIGWSVAEGWKRREDWKSEGPDCVGIGQPC